MHRFLNINMGAVYHQDDIDDFAIDNLIVDGRMGGLVMGRDHSEGGIPMLVKKDQCYEFIGEMEGYEYLLNMGAADYFGGILRVYINLPELHKTEGSINYRVPAHVPIIDCRDKHCSKFLILDQGFAIVNKNSTQGFLETLNLMNTAFSIEEDLENGSILRKLKSLDVIPLKFYDDHYGDINPSNIK